MNTSDAKAEIARFNSTMRAEGRPIAASWIGGLYALEVRGGLRTLYPGHPTSDVPSLRQALRGAVARFQAEGTGE